ncbi:MAG: IclR family transcriptional regulator [Brucella sp.]
MRKRAKAPDQNGDNVGAGSLLRGLEILRAFRSTDSTLGNQDLIDRTGIPKATISRLTAALVSKGYLVYEEAIGRYSIGPSTFSLGYSGLSSTPVVRVARPLLERLAYKTGVAAALGTRSGLEMIYLSNCRAYGPITLQLSIGSMLPIWRTAMGLAYVVVMDEETRSEIVYDLLRNEPDCASLIQKSIDEAMESHERYGYVCSFGTWYSYINAVGVAFRPSDGSQLVALTAGGISDVLTRDDCLTTAGDALLETRDRLRAALENE